MGGSLGNFSNYQEVAPNIQSTEEYLPPEESGAAGPASLAQSFGEAGQASRVMSDIVQQHQNAINTTNVNSIISNLQEQTADYNRTALNNPDTDFQNFPNQTLQYRRQLVEQAAGQLSNPQQQQMLNEWATQSEPTYYSNLLNTSQAYANSAFVTQSQRSTDQLSNMLQSAPDNPSNLALVSSNLNALMSNPAISDNVKNEQYSQRARQYSQAYVIGRIQTQPASVVQADLKNGTYFDQHSWFDLNDNQAKALSDYADTYQNAWDDKNKFEIYNKWQDYVSGISSGNLAAGSPFPMKSNGMRITDQDLVQTGGVDWATSQLNALDTLNSVYPTLQAAQSQPVGQVMSQYQNEAGYNPMRIPMQNPKGQNLPWANNQQNMARLLNFTNSFNGDADKGVAAYYSSPQDVQNAISESNKTGRPWTEFIPQSAYQGILNARGVVGGGSQQQQQQEALLFGDGGKDIGALGKMAQLQSKDPGQAVNNYLSTTNPNFLSLGATDKQQLTYQQSLKMGLTPVVQSNAQDQVDVNSFVTKAQSDPIGATSDMMSMLKASPHPQALLAGWQRNGLPSSFAFLPEMSNSQYSQYLIGGAAQPTKTIIANAGGASAPIVKYANALVDGNFVAGRGSSLPSVNAVAGASTFNSEMAILSQQGQAGMQQAAALRQSVKNAIILSGDQATGQSILESMSSQFYVPDSKTYLVPTIDYSGDDTNQHNPMKDDVLGGQEVDGAKVENGLNLMVSDGVTPDGKKLELDPTQYTAMGFSSTADALQNSQWVNSPNGDGVMLVSKSARTGQSQPFIPFRSPDGQPITVTWQQAQAYVGIHAAQVAAQQAQAQTAYARAYSPTLGKGAQ